MVPKDPMTTNSASPFSSPNPSPPQSEGCHQEGLVHAPLPGPSGLGHLPAPV